MSGRHLNVMLSSPWQHHGPGVEISGFMPASRDEHSELRGRASLTASQGVFSVSMSPTAAELRRIANLCTTLADHMDCTAAQARALQQQELEGAA